jgi:predicted DNA-binding protein YlxM (UPF0122 family)
MAFGEKVKESWDADFQAPPLVHMEIYTLEQISPVLDSIPPGRLMKVLQENNLDVNSTDKSLKDIAADNNTTPSAIYNILLTLQTNKQTGNRSEIPQGAGRFTVAAAAKSSGKNVEDLLKLLKEKGIEANEETTMKTIADKLGVSPREVYEMLVK